MHEKQTFTGYCIFAEAYYSHSFPLAKELICFRHKYIYVIQTTGGVDIMVLGCTHHHHQEHHLCVQQWLYSTVLSDRVKLGEGPFNHLTSLAVSVISHSVYNANHCEVCIVDHYYFWITISWFIILSAQLHSQEWHNHFLNAYEMKSLKSFFFFFH